MGIIYGLWAALSWGVGDYVITHLTRRTGTARAIVMVQSISLLCWIALLLLPAELFWGRQSVAQWDGFQQTIGQWPVWAWVVVAGACHVVGIALSYRAFEIGTLALVSPISSSFAVVTAVLATSTRESPPPQVLAGAGLLFVGVVMATRATSHPEDSSHGLRGVPEALGSAVAYGIMFWMMKPAEQSLGPVLPLIVLKIMATASAVVSLFWLRRRASALVEPSETVKSSLSLLGGLALCVALLDSLAWLAYNAGDRLGYTTVVTALASLFSVITILLAWLLLKDRLAKLQWAGVAVILLGVLLVSLPELPL